MPSTSRFRIPKAPITGLYGAVMRLYAKRAFGEVPDGAYVYFHHKPLLKAVMGFEGKVAKWNALDPTLKSLAQLAGAGAIGCSWCLDYGYFAARNDGLDLAKISQVPVWRDSDVFEPLERDVLEYAEAMTATPPTVTDWMVDKLLDQLGTAAVVELTQMIAVENMRSRFNSAVGLQSQGYSDVCELPLATSAGQAGEPDTTPPLTVVRSQA
ncbi:alkylhydroperoxidase AhpD family core domain-containing protein [Nocardioides terrae]|uniref:Alkylhydroperoxidase AhpD family core domain-containing protein n=1 Tax=Nocardioides terrae TaxID=574651 RepID=A0A1I1DGC2_9ACTN|nr:carboxymuconolactone decarboxylase family protein [Nocardioides terrae]SFB71583.1 alkylhydroperoxidase AhpD family core domain-containing protein [Nocardioides terrae]